MATGYTVKSTDKRLKSSLVSRASSLAAFTEVDELQQVISSKSIDNVEYQILEEHLIKTGDVNPDIRFIYYVARDAEGVYFIADSVDPADPGYSAPGDRYPDAPSEVWEVFDSGSDKIVGPYKDSYGNWISSFVPVKSSTGEIVAVLGMDIDSTNFRTELIRTALVPAGAFGTLLLLAVVGMWIQRKEQANYELKSELVSIASHDLRSPLTGIEWAAKSIADEPQDTQNSTEMGKAIAATTTELRNSVNTILQLAIEGRGIDSKLNKESTELRALLVEVADMFKLPAESHKTKLVIDDNLTSDTYLMLDKEKFKRALSNLISNAIKYTRPDTIISIEYKFEDGNHLIGVRDQGMGIPKADQDKVLAGHHRAANVVRSGIEGTGIGVLLTKHIIEAHGGKLTFESTENVGTVFCIAIPAAQ